MIEVGSRVKNNLTGGIGHVEGFMLIDDVLFLDVRILTPNNTPSCCVTTGEAANWRPVSNDVIPFPMSAEWFEMAREFFDAVRTAIREVG